MGKDDFTVSGRYGETLKIGMRSDKVSIEIIDGEEYVEMMIYKDVFYRFIDQLQKTRSD